MSFQDVEISTNGKSSQRIKKKKPLVIGRKINCGESIDSTLSGSAALSDNILQYQRNVVILEKVTKSIGTESDRQVLQTQYSLQVDIIKQLGSKIEKQLRNQELYIQSLAKTDAAKPRATYLKLTRDFRSVEHIFKNLRLNSKYKRSNYDTNEKKSFDEREGQKLKESVKDDVPLLQIQLQEDRLNEDIMREREEEIRNINKGMHQVNEIYKDLAQIVASQQDQIDEVENHMEEAHKNAENGLKQFEKANEVSENNCVVS